MHKSLGQLFQKEMDRKEFLAHVGAGALAIVGVSGLVKGLLEYTGNSKSHPVRTTGYGSSPYGGSTKPSSPSNLINNR